MKKQILILGLLLMAVGGFAQNYTLDPTEMDFGTVDLGQSATETLWFNSAGNGDVEVTDIIAGDELELSMTAFTLWNGASIPVDVTFTPTVEGNFADSLVIVSDDPEVAEFTYYLMAEVTATPTIVVEPQQLDYEIHLNEAEEQTQTLTIENTGYDTLEVSLNSSVGQGYALEFDGFNEWISFSSGIIPSDGDYTVECWVNGNNDSGCREILAQGTPSNAFYIGYASNDKFRIGDGWTETPIYFPFNEWHNITVVKNSTNTLLFIDGYLATEKGGSIPNPNQTNYFRIGKQYSEGEYWNGVIDEIRISDNARYNNDFNPQNRFECDINTIGLWHFDEGNGVTLFDSSPYNNVGLLQNMTNDNWVESPFLQNVDWLTLSETTLTIPPGESATVDVTANGADMEYGDYEATIQLTSNDPDSPLVEVPVTMSVLYPIAVIDTTAIDFGEVGFNSITNYELGITNLGNAELEINTFVADSISSFYVTPAQLVVLPDSTEYLTVSVATTILEAELSDLLQISTNDIALPSLEIPLSATVVPAERPVITAITDVPDDQGGWVYVNFTRSFYDTDTLRTEMYEVQIQDGENWVTGQVATAWGSNVYSVLVHTLYDSTASSDGLFNFRVIAAMEEGNWASDIVQGYSVDNIAPFVPDGVCGSADGNIAELYWLPSSDADFQYFAVYKSAESGNFPNEPFATLIDTSFVDEEYSNDMRYYVVTAFDYAGNESAYSEELDLYLVEVEDNSLPTITKLYGNYPNPFNPITTISYQLPKTCVVRLSIYNIKGQLVETLVNEQRSPGSYSATWYANDVSSGLYFYKLTTENQTITKKMLLMK